MLSSAVVRTSSSIVLYNVESELARPKKFSWSSDSRGTPGGMEAETGEQDSRRAWLLWVGLEENME